MQAGVPMALVGRQPEGLVRREASGASERAELRQDEQGGAAVEAQALLELRHVIARPQAQALAFQWQIVANSL
jgi:hypothetical protein